MRTRLLYPSSAISDDVPIEQIRLPWNIRRTLAATGLKTVGDVRKSTNELLLRSGLDRGIVDHIRATLGSRGTIELKLGDRVRLSELGVSRSPKIKVHTGIVAVPCFAGSAIISVLFDGNKRPTRIHCTYVELDDRANAK